VLCETTLLWGVCFTVDLRLCCREWQSEATPGFRARIRVARGRAMGQVLGAGLGYAVAYLYAFGVLIPLGLLALQSSARNAAYFTNAQAMLPPPVIRLAKLASAVYLVAAAATLLALGGLVCLAGSGCADLSPSAIIGSLWIGAAAFVVAALMSGSWLATAAATRYRAPEGAPPAPQGASLGSGAAAGVAAGAGMPVRPLALPAAGRAEPRLAGVAPFEVDLRVLASESTGDPGDHSTRTVAVEAPPGAELGHAYAL
jgi:hypothetical protein